MGTPMAIATAQDRLRDFWEFYRQYTQTAVHTAATAALAIFGLLVFVDPWFAAIAIGCYVVPPVALYALADERRSGAADERDFADRDSVRTEPVVESVTRGPKGTGSGDSITRPNQPDGTSGNGDTDTDRDGSDADGDSDGGGTDTDSDSDGDGTDTDADADGTDTDSDSATDGTDTDSDRDG
ncbi:hypothetical protein [Natronolimnohabitans innermongolicus]|uniref:Uncharacterized protein n=1 Tax=Natronolimnohabitans innermongolicus JCM 12255 TaxID=1227499 RepID=L9XDV7_9EURY|nr:hypothetical protein [Natronolimnohabitans innermongolicus]ELY59905.1 hypothetical protein C493_04733 [Natronolimnohabitans innermongolicus JCM 12255]